MERKKITQRLTSLLLVLLMLFGAVFPSELAFAAGTERPKVRVTEFTLTDKYGNPPRPEGFTIYAEPKLNIKWDASYYGDQLKEGDFFNITIPPEFQLRTNPSDLQFEIKDDAGNLVANGFVTPNPNGGGTIKAVFTKYVEDKLNVKGNIYSVTDFNHPLLMSQIPIERPVGVTIGDQTVTTILKIQKKICQINFY